MNHSIAARSFTEHRHPGGFFTRMSNKLDPRIEAEIKANGHQISLLREIKQRIKVRRLRGRKMERINISGTSTFPPPLPPG